MEKKIVRFAALLVAAGAVAALLAGLSYAQACCKEAQAEGKACAHCDKAEATELSPEAKEAAEKVRAAGVGFLTAKDLKQKMASGSPPVIVDVLGRENYTAAHVKGAINIPVKEIEELAPKVLPDKSAEIVVYCANYKCGASLEAAKTLKKLGYTNLHDYKGGIQEWRTLGYPVEGTAKSEKTGK